MVCVCVRVALRGVFENKIIYMVMKFSLSQASFTLHAATLCAILNSAGKWTIDGWVINKSFSYRFCGKLAHHFVMKVSFLRF